jgi:hypothetical protein
MEAVTPLSTTKTVPAEFPLTASEPAPGPSIIRFFEISMSPLVSVIALHVGDRLKLMVSPLPAAATAARSEPAPESLQFVTMPVLADAICAGRTITPVMTNPVVAA